VEINDAVSRLISLLEKDTDTDDGYIEHVSTSIKQLATSVI